MTTLLLWFLALILGASGLAAFTWVVPFMWLGVT